MRQFRASRLTQIFLPPRCSPLRGHTPCQEAALPSPPSRPLASLHTSSRLGVSTRNTHDIHSLTAWQCAAAHKSLVPLVVCVPAARASARLKTFSQHAVPTRQFAARLGPATIHAKPRTATSFVGTSVPPCPLQLPCLRRYADLLLSLTDSVCCALWGLGSSVAASTVVAAATYRRRPPDAAECCWWFEDLWGRARSWRSGTVLFTALFTILFRRGAVLFRQGTVLFPV